MTDDFSLGSVEVAQTPQERFEEYLQSRGQRNTRQRKIIVEQVFSQHDHFDADELLLSLRGEAGKPEASRATIYRTLGELVEAGLLRELEISGRTVYEHDYGYPQHDHLHCTDCDKLIEFRSDEFTKIRDAVGKQHAFRVTGHRLIINGICKDCQQKRSRKRSRLDRI